MYASAYKGKADHLGIKSFLSLTRLKYYDIKVWGNKPDLTHILYQKKFNSISNLRFSRIY